MKLTIVQKKKNLCQDSVPGLSKVSCTTLIITSTPATVLEESQNPGGRKIRRMRAVAWILKKLEKLKL